MPRAPDRAGIATPPVHSLHDAAVTLLDVAIETLRRGRDDEAVHAARKACKRVRAALRLLRGRLGARAYRRENRRVRDAAKPLTALRDAFMLRRILRTLRARPASLAHGLTIEYRRERRAFERGGTRRSLQLLTATREKLMELPAVDSESASAVAGVRAAYKAGRKALSKARRRDDEALHEWRKQAKYLLNQLELIETVFHAKFKKLRRRADELAEVLGDDHDLGVLVGKLRRYEGDDRSLLQNIEKRRARRQRRAFKLGKDLYARSAKGLAAELTARLTGPS